MKENKVWRHEKKYRVEGFSAAQVTQQIRLHPAGLRQIFPDRRINNIYFDTPALTTFHQNVAGINQRKKFRLRWYGEDLKQIHCPVFEIKIKNNELGRKENFSFFDTQVSDIQNITKEVNHLSPRNVSLHPVILNTYFRSYYGTSNGKFRVTIDRDLRYTGLYATGTLLTLTPPEPAVIVEVKYIAALDNEAHQIFNYLPFRQTKNSKYVTGVLSTLDWIGA